MNIHLLYSNYNNNNNKNSVVCQHIIGNLDIYLLISPSNAVNIQELTLMLDTIDHWEVKYIVTLPIKIMTCNLKV